MRRMTRWMPMVLVLPLLLWIIGCGGGTSGTGNTSRAPLNVYITDAFNDDYRQVLATIYRIELSTNGTNYTTVFDSTMGDTLDLSSLSDTAELLASLSFPTGNYTQMRVTYGDKLTLVARNGTSTIVDVDPSVGTISNGRVSVVINTALGVFPNLTNVVYVDFRLSEFRLVGGKVRTVIRGENGVSSHISKRHRAHLRGTIAELTATGFVLVGERDRRVNVTLTNTTTITSGETGETATLANGQSVIVEGTYDRNANSVTSVAITINDFVTVNRAEAVGTVESVDATAKTFVLKVLRSHNFQPQAGTITVVTNNNTRIRKGRNTTGTFADITVGGNVGVVGSFNVPSQTLTARGVNVR